MAPNHEKLATLQARLAEVNARIAAHPLNSAEFARAREVGAAKTDEDAAAVNAELAAQGLPTLGRQARMMALGLTSLARLNRKRIRLEESIARRRAG